MEEWVKMYQDNPNNISYWFPKIKDCGIKVPKTFIIQLPENIMKAIYMERGDEDMEEVYDFVKKEIMPVLSENRMFFFFMKNGTFSNKFDFNNACKCRANPFEVTDHLINICYQAECFGADGISEIALREFIGNWYYINENIPCIYNGMPLRPEYRVFYDFDKRKVLYSANYWDKDYCEEKICKYNATDAIVYTHVYQDIEDDFYDHIELVEKLVNEHMKDVELKGQWSIDIMWDEENQQYWLIDMALAQQSAYWDRSKIYED